MLEAEKGEERASVFALTRGREGEKFEDATLLALKMEGGAASPTLPVAS